ncbi:MAG: hypothetical protein R3C05_10380 [Pirellulaceae bacterium]
MKRSNHAHQLRQRQRRRLLSETLESRAMLATLGLGVEFFEPQTDTPVASLVSGMLYDAKVVVQVTDSNVGVISLPLNYSWDPNVLELVDIPDPNNAGQSYFNESSFPKLSANVLSDLVTPSFVSQRRISAYDADAPRFDSSQVDPTDLTTADQFYNLQGVAGELAGGESWFGHRSQWCQRGIYFASSISSERGIERRSIGRSLRLAWMGRCLLAAVRYLSVWSEYRANALNFARRSDESNRSSDAAGSA